MTETIPFEKGFWASRQSQGSEHRRSFSLAYSTNGSIYLTEQQYGGHAVCPTKEDLRWLRDVLNRLEFCDHDLVPIQRESKYLQCTKCSDWVTKGPVETDIRPPDRSGGAQA